MEAKVSTQTKFCGFHVLPEPQTSILTCSDSNIAPFSLPVEALRFEPPADLVTAKFKNGDAERRIHCNTELTSTEQEKLHCLQLEAAAKQKAFYPSVIAMATRFLSRARGDHKRALDYMQATQDWRQEYFQDGPISDTSIEEDLQHGVVYFTGRDSALRPALVVRGKRIPDKWYKEKRVDKLIRILIFCMEYFLRYMVVPGRVENLCVIVDLKGLSLSQVQLSGLNEIYKVMSHHYLGRVFRFYICNMPSALNMVAGMAKALLTDRQKQKIVMVNNVNKLHLDFAQHQLETDLGGSRPVDRRFLPFPLQPGPFEAGAASGPNTQSIPGVHRVLTRLGTVGRLWDPERSATENEELEFEHSAVDIIERCGLYKPSYSNGQTGADDEDGACLGSETLSDVSRRCSMAVSTEAGTAYATDDVASLTSKDEDWTTIEDDGYVITVHSRSEPTFFGFGLKGCWCSQ